MSYIIFILQLQVELLDLFSSLNFNVLNHLESCCTEVQKGTNHFLGVGRLDIKAFGQTNITIWVQQLNKD